MYETKVHISGVLDATQFSDYCMDRALSKCREWGYAPMYMPDIIDARIANPTDAGYKGMIWRIEITTPSLIIAGKYKGKDTVLVSHVQTYLSHPENLKMASFNANTYYGAAKMPQNEFDRLAGLVDEKNVFQIDPEKLKGTGELMKLEKAFLHPLTIPFLGGVERAEKYFKVFDRLFKEKMFGVWHNIAFFDEPTARLLCTGFNTTFMVVANNGLSYPGHFLGVPASVPAQTPRDLSSVDNLVDSKVVEPKPVDPFANYEFKIPEPLGDLEKIIGVPENLGETTGLYKRRKK